jgi:transcriptional regulator with XRE-family HTH domain
MAVPNDEVRDFVTSRWPRSAPTRSSCPPEATAGYPGYAGPEVALLTGVSVEYYSRLERGNVAGASEAVLDAIARAPQLNDAERDHLFALARAASTSPRGGNAAARRHDDATRPAIHPPRHHRRPRPSPQRPPRHHRRNTLGPAMHATAYANSRRPVNLARHCFLDRDSAEQFYPDWDNAADAIVAILRASGPGRRSSSSSRGTERSGSASSTVTS